MHDIIKSGISAGKDPMRLAAAAFTCPVLNQKKIQRYIADADAAGATEIGIRIS